MRRQFFRFGVRQLLLLVSVLSVFLAVVTWRTQNERKIKDRIRIFEEAQANLEKAVRNNDVALARKALEAGAYPNATLGPCIENGQLAIIELLLESGADVEQMMAIPGSLVGNGPPIYAAILCRQPTQIRLKMIRLLVKYGADPRRDVGRNAMDLAVHHSEPEVADLLVELGLPYGPREMAAFNRLEELQSYVEQNPNILRERVRPLYGTKTGQEPTLLGIALRRGYREMVLFLMGQGAPLDTLEELGLTLLHLAARGGNPELIRLLVARGLDVNAKDERGDTPLTDCAWDASPEAVLALIEVGADVNARRSDGKTALHLAVSNERVEVVQVLLAADANLMIPDRNGQTAVDIARTKNGVIAGLLTKAVQRNAPVVPE